MNELIKKLPLNMEGENLENYKSTVINKDDGNEFIYIESDYDKSQRFLKVLITIPEFQSYSDNEKLEVLSDCVHLEWTSNALQTQRNFEEWYEKNEGDPNDETHRKLALEVLWPEDEIRQFFHVNWIDIPELSDEVKAKIKAREESGFFTAVSTHTF